ncbi:hypothetical protein [Microcoleus sp. D2_18a_D3]|uniref:hypothetical protein n=1 Tax=Microcoleus sp. D2_18a_D3 TaxID=3055330 RepID=UPI002FD22978
MKAAKLEIGIRSQESGARRKESEGRRKKCFCKYEMLPINPFFDIIKKCIFQLTVERGGLTRLLVLCIDGW